MSMANNQVKNAGLDVTLPKDKCTDKNCPFHGELRVHGKTFVGVVHSSKPQKTAVVEWSKQVYVPKYERYKNVITRISVHNPPCINAVEGDKVRIVETRPLSKTKNFVIVEKVGHVAHFKQVIEAREEAAVKQRVAADEEPQKKVSRESSYAKYEAPEEEQNAVLDNSDDESEDDDNSDEDIDLEE